MHRNSHCLSNGIRATPWQMQRCQSRCFYLFRPWNLIFNISFEYHVLSHKFSWHVGSNVVKPERVLLNRLFRNAFFVDDLSWLWRSYYISVLLSVWCTSSTVQVHINTRSTAPLNTAESMCCDLCVSRSLPNQCIGASHALGTCSSNKLEGFIPQSFTFPCSCKLAGGDYSSTNHFTWL